MVWSNFLFDMLDCSCNRHCTLGPNNIHAVIANFNIATQTNQLLRMSSRPTIIHAMFQLFSFVWCSIALHKFNLLVASIVTLAHGTPRIRISLRPQLFVYELLERICAVSPWIEKSLLICIPKWICAYLACLCFRQCKRSQLKKRSQQKSIKHLLDATKFSVEPLNASNY